MATPSGTVSAPVVRSSFSPEVWSKESAFAKGLTVMVVGLASALFLYALYKIVSDLSKSLNRGSNFDGQIGSWTSTDSDKYWGMYSVQFTLTEGEVKKDLSSEKESLIFHNTTLNSKVVGIFLLYKCHRNEEIYPLMYQIAAKEIKTLTFDQMFKNWLEDYTSKTGKKLEHQGYLNRANFQLKKITMYKL